MKLKCLTADHKGSYSGFDFTPYLPKGSRPGKWLPKVKELEICRSGWHGCDDADIIEYLQDEMYEVETRGNVIRDSDKWAATQMRLVRKCEGWNEKTARLFAYDCAERSLRFFEEKYPGDKRPRMSIETARRFAEGKATRKEMAAAGAAARDAAWDAARAAARVAARAAARAAAGAAAWAAARDAAWAAVGDASWDAAWDAAWDAERKWQWTRLKKLL